MTVSQQRGMEDLAHLQEKILAGEDLFYAGETQQAIVAFSEALAIDPDNATVHSNLGVVYWQLGDTDKALRHLGAAYDADPDDGAVIHNLAEVYAVIGRPDEIRRICSAYLEKHPASCEIRDMMDRLVADAESVGSNAKDDLAPDLLNQADILYSRGETQKALTVLQAALALSSSNALNFLAHRLSGEIYYQAGQPARSMHHLMEAFRIDSGNRETALQLVRVLHELQRHDTAEHVLATFLCLHPDDQQAAELLKINTQKLEESRRPAAAEAVSGDNPQQQESPASLVQRIPEMNDTLRALVQLGVEINSILDVGVLHGTPALMQNFQSLKHYLFEPIDDHFDTIKTNYARFDIELHHVALSNTDGEAWQNGICNNASGSITHSHISDEPLTREQEPRLIISKPVRKARLDSLVPGLGAATPYLLKIDVDGHEIPILEGAVDTLKQASVVVIEATRGTLLNRAQMLADSGFVLFDIVDFAYYAGVLHQVDLVFVRKDIFQNNDNLRAMEVKGFNTEYWYPLSYRCFGK